MGTHRTYVGLVAALATTSLMLAACGPNDDEHDSNGEQVEVFTWWTSGGEKAGLDGLVGVFNEKYPTIEFVNGAVAGGAGSSAKDILQSRLQSHEPPDTFQSHAGMALTDYIEAGQVQDVSNLYEDFGLTDAFPQDLIDLLTVNGKIYSVPANIHRSNMVWASPAVLTECGLDPAATYATMGDWIAAMETIKAAGKVPLSVATTWTQVNLLETVLMSDLGSDAYTGLWDGTTDWAGADVTQALTDFQTLMSFTNTDREGLDWPDAAQMVVDGNAAFNVMGDWVPAEFDTQGLVAGTDYIYFPVPGTDQMFGFLADSFTLPVNAPHPEAAKAWLDVVGSLEGQTAFNIAKGSIPARTDTNPASFSEYQQSAIEAFANDAIVPSLTHGAAASAVVSTAISDAVSRFTTGGSHLAAFQGELGEAVR